MKPILLQYNACIQCPRACGINRNNGEKAFCNEDSQLKIGSACLHFGEEPVITVQGGSGTIFISGCNLGCVFCQNYQISKEGMGKTVTPQEFSSICLALQEAGAENINIVTGSHAIPALAHGLKEAKKQGLTIPICWNSSAFETLEALELLSDVVDIWLPDLKTLNNNISNDLFFTKDYAKTATEAITKMIKMAPLQLESVTKNNQSTEKMLSGVIIRHLVLPSFIQDSFDVLDWLKLNADGKACISIMSQYTPIKKLSSNKAPNRPVSQKEFSDIEQSIHNYCFEYLFYQELIEDDTWLPDFDRTQPFSNELAKPIWHWKKGFI